MQECVSVSLCRRVSVSQQECVSVSHSVQDCVSVSLCRRISVSHTFCGDTYILNPRSHFRQAGLQPALHVRHILAHVRQGLQDSLEHRRDLGGDRHLVIVRIVGGNEPCSACRPHRRGKHRKRSNPLQYYKIYYLEHLTLGVDNTVLLDDVDGRLHPYLDFSHPLNVFVGRKKTLPRLP